MTQDRRITDKLPGQPLQWDDNAAPAASPSAAPAAGQAGLAKLDELVTWDAELYHRGPLGIPDARMAVFNGGGFYRVEDVREVFATLAAPVAADTEQATDDQQAEPVAYLRWWARQYDQGHGNIGHDEGFEVCEPHDHSDDGAPAFPVYAAPLATPADAGAGPILTTGNEQIDSFLAEYEIRADEGVYALTAHDRWVIANFLIELGEEVPFLARMSTPGAQVTASELPENQWLIDGSLLYRLKDGRNCDEINVTMANGSRDDFMRNCVATALKRMIESDYSAATGQSPAPVTAEPVAWKELEPLVTDYARHLLNVDYWSGEVRASSILTPAYESRDRLKAAIYCRPAPADRDAIRDQALEEAACECDSRRYESAAQVIRALKSMERAADVAETRDAKGGGK